MSRTTFICFALTVAAASAPWAGKAQSQTAAGDVSQISPPAASAIDTDQISPRGGSAASAQQLSPRGAATAPAQQLSPRSAGAEAPVSITPRAAGRNVAAAPVQGRDRCDPAAATASSNACADILDSRAGEFDKPSDPSQTATVDTGKPASGLVDDILKNGTGTVVSLPQP
ncbi:MAG TPA: hypothetical protein VGM25_16245 [Caulobacteraceae bacterium]|jgi:hypothetical protein